MKTLSASLVMPWATLVLAATCLGVFQFQESNGYVRPNVPWEQANIAQKKQYVRYAEFTHEYASSRKTVQDAIESGSPTNIALAARSVLTSIFIHSNRDHITSNLLSLLLIGLLVEPHIGGVRLLLLFLTGGVAGSMADVHLGLGASAGICGIVGAGIVIGYRLNFLKRPFFTSKLKEGQKERWDQAVETLGRRCRLLMIFFGGLQLSADLAGMQAAPAVISGPTIGYDAHVWGYAAGAALGIVLVLLSRSQRQILVEDCKALKTAIFG